MAPMPDPGLVPPAPRRLRRVVVEVLAVQVSTLLLLSLLNAWYGAP